jgi:gamma-glutamyltranspeptidase/glutathione hydrolase
VPLRLAAAANAAALRVLALVVLLVAAPLGARASTASGAHGAVVTDQALASDVGLRVLLAHGNAVDAAVAIAYTLAVTYPSAGNIGGGGFMLIRLADGTNRFIDFRETAPAAATATMYQDAHRAVVAGRSTIGALAIAVPGTVAGLELARERYGTRSRHELMVDAEAYAVEGFPLSAADAGVLASHAADFERFPATAATLGAVPAVAGTTFKQPALGATLRAIDRDGPDAFYKGDIAKRMVAAVRGAGGILSLDDLAAYHAQLRAPLECVHGGHTFITAPPPSSGGVALCEILGIIGDGPVGLARTVADTHRELEAERRAFADRSTALGDPDFTTPPIARLLAPAYLAAQRAAILPDRATPSATIAGLAPHEGNNTTHFAVVDADGNAVAVTYTLNSSFGSDFVAGDTGILLNDEMDDFTAAPGVPNQFGLVQGALNAIAPRKRPLSSMSPTIVTDRDGHVVLTAGAAGGPRIITATLDILRDVLDFHLDVGSAVAAPRFHEQWLPDVVDAEPQTFNPRTFAALKAMGYRFDLGPAGSDANAIAVGPDGTRVAAHDDRRPTGSALAY